MHTQTQTGTVDVRKETWVKIREHSDVCVCVCVDGVIYPSHELSKRKKNFEFRSILLFSSFENWYCTQSSMYWQLAPTLSRERQSYEMKGALNVAVYL